MENADTTFTLPAAAAAAAASAAETIGRYTRADLEAMHGKRGRKPPEYFTIFPERVRVAPTPRRSKLAEAPLSVAGGYDADPLVARLRLASPAVRRLVSDLLDVVAGSAPLQTNKPTSQPTSQQADAPAFTCEDSPAAEPMPHEMILSEPVYADPELEPELVEQG